MAPSLLFQRGPFKGHYQLWRSEQGKAIWWNWCL